MSARSAAAPSVFTEASRPLTTEQRSSIPGGPLPAAEVVDRLEQQGPGCVDEFVLWRQRVQNFPDGLRADVDLTQQDVVSGQWRSVPEFWYPSLPVFHFHRTASYWCATLFLEGSIIFTLTSALGCWTGEGRVLYGLEHSLVVLPNMIGAWFYTVGAYLGFFQLINIPNKNDDNCRITFWTWNWRRCLSYTDPVSVIGVLSYFVGAVLFQISASAAVFPLSYLKQLILVDLSGVLASCLFIVGAAMECKYNESFSRVKLLDAKWWVCITYLIGGVAFLLAYLAAIQRHEYTSTFVTIPFVVGSVAYTLGSVFMVFLWKEQQYGFVLLWRLNKVPRRASKAEASFSVRAMCFLMLYAIVASVSVFNMCVSYVHKPDSDILMLASHVTADCVAVVLIHAMLTLHSAMTKMPTVQPVRLVFMIFRFALVLAGGSSILRFVSFVRHLAIHTASDRALDLLVQGQA